MPDFKIILMEPEYPINLGYCARVLANFGYPQMHIVKPKAKIGKIAIMHAKHGHHLLENARIYPSLGRAVSDCDFVVGTTGIAKRGKTAIRNPLNLEQFLTRVKASETGMKASGGRASGAGKEHGAGEAGTGGTREAGIGVGGKRYAILFGREGTGLNQEEITRCDLLVSIPADKKYPVLNLSHALAIVLYSLSHSRRYHLIKNAKRGEKEELEKTFSEIADFFKPSLRNPQKIKNAFRRVLGRSLVSDVEAAALLCVFKMAKEEIRGKRKR